MPELSLVFGYRNRDISRVENCLRSLAQQSFSDFETIFIDYGSEEEYSRQLLEVLVCYPFAKYTKSYTTGWPWNRAQALNIGVKLAEAEYLMTQDVDLVFSKDYIKVFYDARREDKVVYSNCYLLPQRYDRDPVSETRTDFPVQGGGNGIGLFPTKAIKKLQGYDEFYCLWGVEDRDLRNRMNSIGITDDVIALEKAPVYHQWHEQTNLTKNFLPAGWWEEMNCHFFEQKDHPKRNKGEWGKLITDGERPALKFLEDKTGRKDVSVTAGVNLISFLDEWSTAFSGCRSGEAVRTKLPAPGPLFIPASARAKGLVSRVLGKLAGLAGKGQQVVDYPRLSDEFSKLSAADLYKAGFDELRSYFWTYIRRNKEAISDYYFDNYKGEFTVIIVKK